VSKKASSPIVMHDHKGKRKRIQLEFYRTFVLYLAQKYKRVDKGSNGVRERGTWIHAVYILERDSARWLQSGSSSRVISGWRGQSGQVGAASRTGLMWQVVPGWRGKSFPVGKC
jgi:hypothetical protein